MAAAPDDAACHHWVERRYCMLTYIACPIDQVGPHDIDWSERVLRLASQAEGLTAFHPANAFTVAPSADVDSSIERANRAVLEQCGALVALLPAGTGSSSVQGPRLKSTTEEQKDQ